MLTFYTSVISILRKFISVLLVISLLSGLVNCSYYKATTLRSASSGNRIDLLNSKYYYFEGSYFVVHFGNETWQLNNIQLNGKENNISGTLSVIDPNVKFYFDKIENKLYSRYRNSEKEYIRQIHLFINEYTLDGNKIIITNDNLVQVEVLDPAFGPTALSYLLVGGATAFTALMIYLYIVCNCPHVYTTDGENYSFSHTLFTGAVNPELERSDYQVLPQIDQMSDSYDFFVKNDEEEEQFTDQIGLIVAHHNPGTYVLPDQKGTLHAYSKPVSPIVALTDNGSDVTETISDQDDISYQFDKNKNKLSELYLTFPGQKKNNGKLILRLKNTLWAGLVYHEFQQLFGSNYSEWVEKNQSRSKEDLLKWQKNQGIILSVEVKRENRWEHLEYIDLVGEAGYNSLVVSLNRLPADKNIDIRLTSGFKFWEIDYAAVSFLEEEIVEVQQLLPHLAIDSEGRDHTFLLANDDGVYMEHLEKGESTHVTFTGLKNIKGKKRTLILKSNGFYISKKEVNGKTRYFQLLKLTRNGEFSVFSKELHDRIRNSTIYIN